MVSTRSNTVVSRALALLVAVCFIAGALATAPPAYAQHAATTHKKNFAQRHPTMTSAAAGYAAYKAAKITGRNRAMHGQRKNFAQRHPILTGVAAAGVTHHYIKKSMKNHH